MGLSYRKPNQTKIGKLKVRKPHCLKRRTIWPTNSMNRIIKDFNIEATIIVIPNMCS
jgi:hypothetical protein